MPEFNNPILAPTPQEIVAVAPRGVDNGIAKAVTQLAVGWKAERTEQIKSALSSEIDTEVAKPTTPEDTTIEIVGGLEKALKEQKALTEQKTRTADLRAADARVELIVKRYADQYPTLREEIVNQAAITYGRNPMGSMRALEDLQASMADEFQKQQDAPFWALYDKNAHMRAIEAGGQEGGNKYVQGVRDSVTDSKQLKVDVERLRMEGEISTKKADDFLIGKNGTTLFDSMQTTKQFKAYQAKLMEDVRNGVPINVEEFRKNMIGFKYAYNQEITTSNAEAMGYDGPDADAMTVSQIMLRATPGLVEQRVMGPLNDMLLLLEGETDPAKIAARLTSFNTIKEQEFVSNLPGGAALPTLVKLADIVEGMGSVAAKAQYENMFLQAEPFFRSVISTEMRKAPEGKPQPGHLIDWGDPKMGETPAVDYTEGVASMILYAPDKINMNDPTTRVALADSYGAYSHVFTEGSATDRRDMYRVYAKSKGLPFLFATKDPHLNLSGDTTNTSRGLAVLQFQTDKDKYLESKDILITSMARDARISEGDVRSVMRATAGPDSILYFIDEEEGRRVFGSDWDVIYPALDAHTENMNINADALSDVVNTIWNAQSVDLTGNPKKKKQDFEALALEFNGSGY